MCSTKQKYPQILQTYVVYDYMSININHFLVVSHYTASKTNIHTTKSNLKYLVSSFMFS